jgi:hypothetical protein
MAAQAPGPDRPAGAGLTEAVAEPEGFAACPTCHMVDAALTSASLAAGGHWRCGRCGQVWDQKRIAIVAAYGAWESARQRRQAKAKR